MENTKVRSFSIQANIFSKWKKKKKKKAVLQGVDTYTNVTEFYNEMTK